MPSTSLTTIDLLVPPLARVVEDDVFDAWSWCESDVLVWQRPERFDIEAPVSMSNPSDLVFVVHNDDLGAFLPRELAHLHARGFSLKADTWALAPYGIDDATDLFFEHRVRPRDVLWLAASSLAALVWGLHDWAHFHHHGPFEDPPSTELACDLVALAWLRRNAERAELGPAQIERVALELATLTRARFSLAGRKLPPFAKDPEALFLGPYPSRTSTSQLHEPREREAQT